MDNYKLPCLIYNKYILVYATDNFKYKVENVKTKEITYFDTYQDAINSLQS